MKNACCGRLLVELPIVQTRPGLHPFMTKMTMVLVSAATTAPSLQMAQEGTPGGPLGGKSRYRPCLAAVVTRRLCRLRYPGRDRGYPLVKGAMMLVLVIGVVIAAGMVVAAAAKVVPAAVFPAVKV